MEGWHAFETPVYAQSAPPSVTQVLPLVREQNCAPAKMVNITPGMVGGSGGGGHGEAGCGGGLGLGGGGGGGAANGSDIAQTTNPP